MVGSFRSDGEARHRFEAYARVDPRLADLWMLCETAAPNSSNVSAGDQDDEGTELDCDDGGWCAEDYFLQTVKPRLRSLVGWDRLDGEPSLRTAEAYDIVYSALFYHALARPCVCCRSPSLWHDRVDAEATIGS
jgi:hypothetical protein